MPSARNPAYLPQNSKPQDRPGMILFPVEVSKKSQVGPKVCAGLRLSQADKRTAALPGHVNQLEMHDYKKSI